MLVSMICNPLLWEGTLLQETEQSMLNASWAGEWVDGYEHLGDLVLSFRLVHLLSLIISFLKVIFSLLLKWDGYCYAYFAE